MTQRSPERRWRVMNRRSGKRNRRIASRRRQSIHPALWFLLIFTVLTLVTIFATSCATTPEPIGTETFKIRQPGGTLVCTDSDFGAVCHEKRD